MIKVDDIKEVQKIELEILKFVDRICKENNLQYYLDYGTLIGAIRHKGFIPWDDDIDISMPRRDYNKLIELLTSQDSKYRIITHRNQNDYIYAFAKVIDTETVLVEYGVPPIQGLGVYIDIFPVDGVSEDIIATQRQLKEIRKISLKWYFSMQDKCPAANVIKRVLKWPYWKYCKNTGTQKLIERIDEVAQMNKFEDSKIVGCFVGAELDKTFFEKTGLKTIDGEFEGYHFSIPQEYDAYLRQLFGDYMQLPPEKERVSHGFEVWQKDTIAK